MKFEILEIKLAWGRNAFRGQTINIGQRVSNTTCWALFKSAFRSLPFGIVGEGLARHSREAIDTAGGSWHALRASGTGAISLILRRVCTLRLQACLLAACGGDMDNAACLSEANAVKPLSLRENGHKSTLALGEQSMLAVLSEGALDHEVAETGWGLHWWSFVGGDNSVRCLLRTIYFQIIIISEPSNYTKMAVGRIISLILPTSLIQIEKS